MLLEGVHFQRSWDRPRDLGRKALAVNISDIAAMGGQPLYALLGLAIPPDGPGLQELEALLAGLEEEAERYGVTLVGGDTCVSRSGLVVSVTLLGAPPAESVLLRSGAKPGDGLWVTGRLGGAAAGLLALEAGFRPNGPWPERTPRPGWLGSDDEAAIRDALMAHLTPVPRLVAGQALVGCATAAIDVSDGVASDVGHLCKESQVAVRISAGALPIHPGAVAMARLTGRGVLDLALGGGEDYELLFASKIDPAPHLAAAVPELPVTRIGEVCFDPPIPTLVHDDGREEALVGGFNHLRPPARGGFGLR
jgi:thiamine-monophosphate kinase